MSVTVRWIKRCKIMWQSAESQVFRQTNFSNIRGKKIIAALLQRFEDHYQVNMTKQKSHYSCKITEGWVCLQVKNDPKRVYCTKLTWCILLKGKTIIWLMIYGSGTKSWKFKFCWRFACHHCFRYRYYWPRFLDADLIFIVVWEQMIGFSNMANYLIWMVDHTAT